MGKVDLLVSMTLVKKLATAGMIGSAAYALGLSAFFVFLTSIIDAIEDDMDYYS